MPPVEASVPARALTPDYAGILRFFRPPGMPSQEGIEVGGAFAMRIHAFCDRVSFVLPVRPGFSAVSANKRAFRQRVGGKLFACSLAGHGINIFPNVLAVAPQV